MKVVFVCPFVPWPLETGGKIRTFHLVREASKHVEVHLRVVREPGGSPGAEAALGAFCASVRFCERTPPATWTRLARPKLERWFHSAELRETLRSDLARGDVSLVHLDELLLARILPQRCRAPVVQHHHKLDTVLYGSLARGRDPRHRFDLWKLQRLEAEAARRYRHHLLCSEEDAQLLRRRYGALDCEVVPSGFDPAHYRPSTPPPPRDPDRLVFVGSMDYGPNVDGVLWFAEKILPRLLPGRPGLVLEVVGANPTPAVRRLEGAHVRVTGRVERIPPYLERAACMVVPLRIGGGTRLKIVEALALATPVVSTPIGAEGLGLEDDRHLLLAADPEGFAAAVQRLLDDPAGAQRMGTAGRDRVRERFTWEALGQDLVDYWERVAFSGTPSPSR